MFYQEVSIYPGHNLIWPGTEYYAGIDMAIVVSASRRTDIASFYTDWFFERLGEGFVDVVNPWNPRQIRHLSLRPEDVACFVFWTRDASPMLRNLSMLEKYAFYFQVTVNGYGVPMEPSGPGVEAGISALKALSSELGSRRVVWRYDPVLLTEQYNSAWHVENFKRLAGEIGERVRHCVLSFYDSYMHSDKRLSKAGYRVAPVDRASNEVRDLMFALVGIARENGLSLSLCAEPELKEMLGFEQYACIDACIISELSRLPFSLKRDKNQRKGCHCIESVDLGSYGTCPRGCLYCYANRCKANISQ